MNKRILLLAAVSTGAMLSAHAASFSGSSSGTFNNPVTTGNPSAVYTGMGSSSITFGNADGFGTGPNALTFTGAGFGSVLAETPFTVGSLYYFNGTVVSGTTLSGVGLDVQLTFTLPNGLGDETFDFP